MGILFSFTIFIIFGGPLNVNFKRQTPVLRFELEDSLKWHAVHRGAVVQDLRNFTVYKYVGKITLSQSFTGETLIRYGRVIKDLNDMP